MKGYVLEIIMKSLQRMTMTGTEVVSLLRNLTHNLDCLS